MRRGKDLRSLVIAAMSLLVACDTESRSGTSSSSSSATTTSTDEAAVPLVRALPVGPCDGIGDAPQDGQITFATVDPGALLGVASDGSALRCLVPRFFSGTLDLHVRWGPRGDRVLLGSFTAFLPSGRAETGLELGLDAHWSMPDGRFILTTDGRLLRQPLGGRAEDISFLAKHFEAIHDPTGAHIVATGTARDGRTGLFVADGEGRGAREVPLPSGVRGPNELAFDAAGRLLFAARDGDDHVTLHRVDLESGAVERIARDRGNHLRVEPSPFDAGLLAYGVVDCDDAEQDQGIERTTVTARSGGKDKGKHIDGSPLGWLPDATLVVSRGNPCATDTLPVDLFLVRESSLTLLVRNVVLPAVRAVRQHP